jgi:hypothetical protein
LNNLRNDSEYTEVLDLAILIRELSSRGDEERTLCKRILESILEYSDSKADTSYLSY